MIELKRSSRVMRFWFFNTAKSPRNLCHLFWGTIGFASGLAALAGMALVAAALTLVVAFGATASLGALLAWAVFGAEALSLLSITEAGLFGAPLAALLALAIHYRAKSRRGAGPSLLRLWLRAKKEKVCPLVRVVE